MAEYEIRVVTRNVELSSGTEVTVEAREVDPGDQHWQSLGEDTVVQKDNETLADTVARALSEFPYFS